MKTKKGFTLIELIVVLAILAIVAAIAVPTAFGSIEKARVAADKATVDSLNSAIRISTSLYANDTAERAKLTVGKAITESGFSKVEVQSNGSIDWVASTTAGSPGAFVYVDGNTGKYKKGDVTLTIKADATLIIKA